MIVYKDNLFLRHLWKKQDPGMEIWQNCLKIAEQIPVFWIRRPAAGDSTAEVAAEVHALRNDTFSSISSGCVQCFIRILLSVCLMQRCTRGKSLCDYSIGNTGAEVKKCIMIVRILQEVSQKRYCLHRGHFRRTRFRRDVL